MMIDHIYKYMYLYKKKINLNTAYQLKTKSRICDLHIYILQSMLSVLIIWKVNKDAKRALKKKTHSDLVPSLTKNNTCNVYFFKVRRHNEGFLFVCSFSLKDKKKYDFDF